MNKSIPTIDSIRFKKISIILLSIIILHLISFATAYPEGWIVKPLTTLPKELHEAPSIAVYEKNIHVVWNTWHNEFDSKIYYTHSLDNGKNWSEPICLTPNSTAAIYPVIAVNATTIHIAWKDYRNGNPEIYYRRSTDNGKTWEETQRITYNSSRKNNIYDIGIQVWKNNVYLVWKDYRSGSSEIFFKKSTDNGETWGPDQRLTYDYTPSYSPCMVVDNDNIYIAWEDWGLRSNICFMKSNNNGVNWTNKTYLTSNTAKGDSEQPSLAVWKNHVYLVWQDTRNGKNRIYFKKSNDYGNTWGKTKQITDNTTVYVNPKIRVYQDRIVVTGQCKKNGEFAIWYETSLDGGENWSKPALLTEGKVDAYDVDMTMQSNNLYIVWQKYYQPGWAEIWYMSNAEQNPTITSITFSNISITPPARVNITINGFDPTYNKTDLTCILQYKPPSGAWVSVPCSLKKDHWEAHLDFSKNSISGKYLVRAKLKNPTGEESEWSNVYTLTISNANPSLPGFTLIISVLAICLFIIRNLVKK